MASLCLLTEVQQHRVHTLGAVPGSALWIAPDACDKPQRHEANLRGAGEIALERVLPVAVIADKSRRTVAVVGVQGSSPGRASGEKPVRRVIRMAIGTSPGMVNVKTDRPCVQ
jgi:hypothetical protein